MRIVPIVLAFTCLSGWGQDLVEGFKVSGNKKVDIYNFYNDTDMVILFKVVMEKFDFFKMENKPLETGFRVLNPHGHTSVWVQYGGSFHVEVPWAGNGDLLKKPNVDKTPSDDFQKWNSTYYGVGTVTPEGLRFDLRPRGHFRMKGPSEKYPPFHDPNQYLCLASD